MIKFEKQRGNVVEKPLGLLRLVSEIVHGLYQESSSNFCDQNLKQRGSDVEKPLCLDMKMKETN